MSDFISPCDVSVSQETKELVAIKKFKDSEGKRLCVLFLHLEEFCGHVLILLASESLRKAS